MDIRSIRWGEALSVRHQVLWPDKAPLFCKVEGDETANHFGVYVDSKLVSVASVYIDGNTARLRKFATLAEYQGKGIGSGLIAYILQWLESVAIEIFWCDARKTAVGFYKRFGMRSDGDEFTKSGIQYYRMELNLV
ncbi:GNAT family N-acetyltransferase [Photobacterium marinum]|uniref:GNAT family N-acetyltransferase n=1 Tax=Photobacterium marinum TaxID=1056511 RepID=UPI00055EAA51|nr:GNAT family N-acetyltransferase [Photobacterium marinum]